MAKTKPLDAVTFDEELTYRPAEHEVFMSFNNDSDAVAFREWWDDEGAAAFAEYLNNRR